MAYGFWLDGLYRFGRVLVSTRPGMGAGMKYVSVAATFFFVDTAERKAMEFVTDLFELLVDLVIGCLLFYSLSLSSSHETAELNRAAQ